MSVTATMIGNVISAAQSAFPAAVLALHWGRNHAHTVQALRSETTGNDSDSELSGNISGQRGRLRVILSECDPWEPPKDGDTITLDDADDNEIGVFTVLGHGDDPTGTVRYLTYGEESA